MQLRDNFVKHISDLNNPLERPYSKDIAGGMDKIHASTPLNAIYCQYLQGINAMNQKTALFVVKNTLKRMGAN
ncbi:hypothetical protein [Psychrobacter vallis]|uniref:hypothetical protein n=1 Tax=Psychrobacter vallis TaxID=248451 RepID=UPI0019191C46|nr:hypothetical protein [Psychrobacter vallis]